MDATDGRGSNPNRLSPANEPARTGPGRRRRIALAVLLAGLAAAAAVFALAPPDAAVDPGDPLYQLDHSRARLRRIELMGGKFALFAAELQESIAGLWEGRARAYTIAALATVIAAGYARFAGPREDPEGEDDRSPE